MKSVLTVEEMRLADENTIKGGIPSRELMYRAGKAVFSSCDYSGKTAIVCGKGNNAGDGYVLASLLKESMHDCVLFLMEEFFSNDGKYYYDICIKKGVETRIVDENIDLSEYDTVVDCIFGTGYKGKPEGKYRTTIEKINESGAYVISVDINSGLNGDNGLGEVFVKSDLTICIGELKPGLFLGRGKDSAKKVINVDIGIRTEKSNIFVAEDTDYTIFIKERDNYSHKGTYGYVGLLGGCESYIGAVKLASNSLASLRGGSGVSRIVVGKNIYPFIASVSVENTIFTVDTDCDGDMIFSEENFSKAFSGLKALGVGMGWGHGKYNGKILKFILENYDIPVVIDADGLNVLASDVNLLRKSRAKVIVTPHLGEMSRLTGLTVDEIERDPISVSRSFSRKYGVITLLKGPTTIVTDGDDVVLVPRGAPGMATAGSGDVLSGIIVGVLGYIFKNILLSVSYATFINGLAGEIAQKKFNDICMVSSDTVKCIPDAITFLRKNI